MAARLKASGAARKTQKRKQPVNGQRFVGQISRGGDDRLIVSIRNFFGHPYVDLRTFQLKDGRIDTSNIGIKLHELRKVRELLASAESTARFLGLVEIVPDA